MSTTRVVGVSDDPDVGPPAGRAGPLGTIVADELRSAGWSICAMTRRPEQCVVVLAATPLQLEGPRRTIRPGALRTRRASLVQAPPGAGTRRPAWSRALARDAGRARNLRLVHRDGDGAGRRRLAPRRGPRRLGPTRGERSLSPVDWWVVGSYLALTFGVGLWL